MMLLPARNCSRRRCIRGGAHRRRARLRNDPPAQVYREQPGDPPTYRCRTRSPCYCRLRMPRRTGCSTTGGCPPRNISSCVRPSLGRERPIRSTPRPHARCTPTLPRPAEGSSLHVVRAAKGTEPSSHPARSCSAVARRLQDLAEEGAARTSGIKTPPLARCVQLPSPPCQVQRCLRWRLGQAPGLDSVVLATSVPCAVDAGVKGDSARRQACRYTHERSRPRLDLWNRCTTREGIGGTAPRSGSRGGRERAAPYAACPGRSGRCWVRCWRWSSPAQARRML